MYTAGMDVDYSGCGTSGHAQRKKKKATHLHHYLAGKA